MYCHIVKWLFADVSKQIQEAPYVVTMLGDTAITFGSIHFWINEIQDKGKMKEA
jgi:hypothetical protein